MNVGDQVTLRYADELEYYDPTTGQAIPSEQADSYQGSLQVRATTYHDVTYEVAAWRHCAEQRGLPLLRR